MCEYDYLTQELVKIDPGLRDCNWLSCLITSQLWPSITLSGAVLQGAPNKPRQAFCVADIAIELKNTIW